MATALLDSCVELHPQKPLDRPVTDSRIARLTLAVVVLGILWRVVRTSCNFRSGAMKLIYRSASSIVASWK